MSDESTTKKWNNITGVVFVVALILGIISAYLTDIFNGLYTVLIVSGVYFAISFYLRDESRESGGPSVTDGAIMGGVLLAGVGLCGYIHYWLDDVMITSICIIAVMIAASGVMIIRNRRFL